MNYFTGPPKPQVSVGLFFIFIYLFLAPIVSSLFSELFLKSDSSHKCVVLNLGLSGNSWVSVCVCPLIDFLLFNCMRALCTASLCLRLFVCATEGGKRGLVRWRFDEEESCLHTRTGRKRERVKFELCVFLHLWPSSLSLSALTPIQFGCFQKIFMQMCKPCGSVNTLAGVVLVHIQLLRMNLFVECKKTTI